MKVLMENWRSYLSEPQYDISPQFAAGSLGLEVPLNESYKPTIRSGLIRTRGAP